MASPRPTRYERSDAHRQLVGVVGGECVGDLSARSQLSCAAAMSRLVAHVAACHRWPASMCDIAAAIRPTGSALRRVWGGVSRSDSAGVRGKSVSVVRFCGGVRSCGRCSFGGGDVFVHRCGGFDPSVGDRRASDAGGARRARQGVAARRSTHLNRSWGVTTQKNVPGIRATARITELGMHLTVDPTIRREVLVGILAAPNVP